MLVIYELVSDNSTERTYNVISPDTSEKAVVLIDKDSQKASLKGNFSSMFSENFIKRLAIGTLKFVNNPPKTFTYGVG